jgi:AcrR family transcriptional regulator
VTEPIGINRGGGVVWALQHPFDAVGSDSSARKHAGAARPSANGAQSHPVESKRRTELLDAAARLIASSGLRTTLRDIADEAGILPGSVYHHFESKDAILVALIRRYHSDLVRISELAKERLYKPDASPISEKIVELGTAIAQCAVRHRAALQMSFFDAPSSDPELVKLVKEPPSAIQDAMLQTLLAGRWSGYIRNDIDLRALADRMCQSMLHLGLDAIQSNAAADRGAAILCHTMLNGLASRPPGDAELDASNAHAAANAVIGTWADDKDTDAVGDKASHIRAVARKEFGRRGYEVTTTRDIASAAGLGTGTIYKLVGSKEELLASIMESFGRQTEAGFVAALRADATPVEKLDALSWLYINTLVQFEDEWKIHLAWMRQSPPNTDYRGLAFSRRVRQLTSMLSKGIRSGEITVDGPPTAMLARCVIDLLWMPESIVRAGGKRAALVLARDTMLRGVADHGAKQRPN